MKTYGYARISTRKQNIERQITNINAECPAAIVIQEAYTGTTTDRPNWNKLKNRVEAGDTIIFDEVSRMSRNAEEGFQDYQELFNRGVNLVFIKERHINTDVYREALQTQIADTGTDVDIILEGVRKYLMVLAKKQIKIAFETAEAEVSFLHERTKEGVQKAKERYLQEEALGLKHEKQLPGGQVGTKRVTKKSVEMKEKIRKMSKSFEGNMKDREVIDILGIERHTYYKYKKEMA